MALVMGVNCGFVTVAPTDNPASTNFGDVDNGADTTRDISPMGATKITEIGWWCSNATPESNFEVGLYAADGAVVPGEAGTLLYVNRTNAKGTDAGWKRVSVNWPISENINYWLAYHLDDTIPNTQTQYLNSGGKGEDSRSLQSTLPNPFGGGTFIAPWELAIYAVYSTASPPPPPYPNPAGTIGTATVDPAKEPAIPLVKLLKNKSQPSGINIHNA